MTTSEKKMVICRQGTREDLRAILDLYAQPALDDGEVLSLPKAEAIYERMSCYPDYKIYVALAEDRIVGTFALLIMDNIGHLGMPSAIIEDVAVAPDFQGQKVGTLMMEYALRVSGERGCYKVMLSSNLKRGKAHAFYESLGFERHGYSFRTNVKQASKSIPVGQTDDCED